MGVQSDNLKTDYLPERNSPVVAFLSTHRSGTTLMACSLLAIFKRPIGKLGKKFTEDAIHGSTSFRLKNLNFISSKPFFYRTHLPNSIVSNRAQLDKLIFLTRNPKELIFKHFDVRCLRDLNKPEIKKFLEGFFKNFDLYESWPAEKRILIFYEDLCSNLNEVLFKTVSFIEASSPIFFEDYLYNQKFHLDVIKEYYVKQHSYNKRKLRNNGRHGESSEKEMNRTYYTQNQDKKILRALDKIIKEKRPEVWEKYLKRFEEK